MPVQLSRIVAVHKALADPVRIRILTLLANGPLHGQALAGKLGITPPTVTHHMSKLREVGFVKEKRDKNTIYFSLNEKDFRLGVEAVLDMVVTKAESGETDMDETMTEERVEKLRREVIHNFFTPDGRLKNLPSKHSRKLFALEHMLRGLETGNKYDEKFINEHIKQFHEDYATIRREFIVHQFMYRDNGIYELNPREMWPTVR